MADLTLSTGTGADGGGIAPASAAAAATTCMKLNPAKQYVKGATLSDIFGASVTPGRELLDIITKTYKAGLGS